jgi:hypothetical protein
MVACEHDGDGVVVTGITIENKLSFRHGLSLFPYDFVYDFVPKHDSWR